MAAIDATTTNLSGLIANMSASETETLPEQSDDDLRRLAREVNAEANAATGVRAHLDRRCGNSATPFDSAAFIQDYRQHLRGFMRLRAQARSQNVGL